MGPALSGESEHVSLGSGESGPVPWGSGEAELVLLGLDNAEPAPPRSDEADPTLRGLDEAAIMPLIRPSELIIIGHQFPFFGYPNNGIWQISSSKEPSPPRWLCLVLIQLKGKTKENRE
jgi:hypothetical protein